MYPEKLTSIRYTEWTEFFSGYIQEKGSNVSNKLFNNLIQNSSLKTLQLYSTQNVMEIGLESALKPYCT